MSNTEVISYDTELVSPESLSVHLALKNMPEMTDDDAQYLPLVADIAKRGIDYPIITDLDDCIVDGRHPWRAASKEDCRYVPVIRRNNEEEHTLIVQSILQRVHYFPEEPIEGEV